MSPAPTTDRFLRYDELTAELNALAAAHPGLMALESIGRSFEGRDIWLVTLTDSATGPHDEKPAMWVDANIHAIEVTGSAAALNLIGRLVRDHGSDPLVTRAMSTRTFYVVPRVNPDGAEVALSDHPRYVRSSVRSWPWRDGRVPTGLRVGDVDGDGRMLNMRILDPNGGWKPHPDEPRLMTHRSITDGPDDGPYYRMLLEGTVHEHDGFTVPTPQPPEGLDLNRNFPAGWSRSVTGSGDRPGGEPEIQALLSAVVARPNICGYNAFHTSGGVLLRPSSTKADSALAPFDVWTWKHLGARCTELTGYPVHSVFEDFTWDKNDTMSGAADDWAYEHLGLFSWTTEFWDVIAAATDHRSPTEIWYTGPSVADELAVLRWLEAEGHGGYVDWYAFDHPQLGALELGGWDWLWTWSNPPKALLANEIAGHADFAVFQALAAPALSIELADAEAIGDGVHRVRVGVANTGWLPTTVSEHAKKEQLVLPVDVTIEVPDGVELLSPAARVDAGQLAGRSHLHLDGGSRHDGTPDCVLVTFLVRGPAGAEVGLVARHQRAGVARATVELG